MHPSVFPETFGRRLEWLVLSVAEIVFLFSLVSEGMGFNSSSKCPVCPMLKSASACLRVVTATEDLKWQHAVHRSHDSWYRRRLCRRFWRAMQLGFGCEHVLDTRRSWTSSESLLVPDAGGHIRSSKSYNRITVVFPVTRRRFGAEAVYAARALASARRELSGTELFLANRIYVLRDAVADVAGVLRLHASSSGMAVTEIWRQTHPQLAEPSTLKLRFGDSVEKVFWRSRLVLDFVSAVWRALALEGGVASAKHVLWLEDDVELLPDFGATLAAWLDDHGARSDWLTLRLLGFARDPDPRTWTWGTRGWGGGGVMLYNFKHLPAHLHFLQENFDAAPLDWLVDRLPAPATVGQWWRPRLLPVRLRHLGEHSTHDGFV